MPILDRVEEGLRDFRPKNHRQLTVLNIASRFNDRDNLAKYLVVAEQYPKKALIEAARRAIQAARAEGTSPPDRFFALLSQWGGKDQS